jgi:hypothetical protein
MPEQIPDYSVLVVGSRPLVLAGPPGPFDLLLDFHNGGEQLAVIRRAALSCDQLEAAAGQGIVVHMSTVVVHPGQSRQVELSVSIPAYTPPGPYQGELQVAGQSVAVEIYIAEDYNLQLSPSEVVIEKRSGERVFKQVACTNGGNVPLVIGEIGAIPLDDELTDCRSLRAVTAAWPEEEGEFNARDRFVDLYVKEGWRKVVEQAGILRVHTPGGPHTIAPGETRLVDLEFTVPENLEPRTRYTGIAPLYTSNLTFMVVTDRARGGASDHDTARKTVSTRKADLVRKAVRARKSAF